MNLENLVIGLYRLFLDRDPENQNAINEKVSLWKESELNCIRSFSESPEFKSKVSRNFANNGHIEYEVDELELDLLFDEVASQWDMLGRTVPYWGVITNQVYLQSDKLSHKKLDDFYISGTKDVQDLLDQLFSRKKLPKNLTVFELGCGNGRLTLPLSEHFRFVFYSDVSSEYLKLTTKSLSAVGRQNTHGLHLKNRSSFSEIQNFDVFYSLITLQHSPPPIQFAVLNAVFDSLSIDGMAIYQIVTAITNYEYSLKIPTEELSGIPKMQMHALPFSALFKLIKRHGLTVLDIIESDKIGGIGMSVLVVLKK
jgi:2-polyprenyl-3-methyl-5-hydroxy-6-metoxy-1,4-benzoquinol methylase